MESACTVSLEEITCIPWQRWLDLQNPQIVIDACNAIIENLWTDALGRHFPKSADDFRNKLQEMECEWQYKYAFAAIEGSHCPINCLAGGAKSMKQYYNFKKFNSVVLLALVDAHYRFIWASIGARGNTHIFKVHRFGKIFRRLN